MADAVEDGESTEASEVSADEDEDEDQGPNMSSLLDCMGVSDNKSPIVGDSPSEEQTVATTSTEEPVVEAEAQPSSEDAAGIAPDDIQQQYAQHQARVERLETLDTLQSKLERLTSSFIFPTSLDFQQQPNTDGTHVVPSLDYTSTNTPYHAHAQSLLGLLVDADGVSSDGDQEIRRRRKEFVLRVEAELDGLEREKERVWRAMAEGGR
ncbi:hypothetical protein QFC19_000696 [Naganishia cerealis]|uniref:Uncharacterized protein n=1 Tax=Naganishia cerealis TaxID=610337 RepID=A0ACC2WP48_9TREE|nr:hypothetical protein QFC19_000696 [Naganishia cerealis]